MEFTLTSHNTRVAHVNVREEKHGEESVKAVDVKLQCDVPNDFLTYLHEDLKAALYAKRYDQGDLTEDADYMPRLRFAELPDLRWSGAFPANVTLHLPGRSKDVVLEANVDHLRLAPKEGGTVGLTFRVAARPDDDVLGKVVALLGIDIKVTVQAREEEPKRKRVKDLADTGEEDDGDGD